MIEQKWNEDWKFWVDKDSFALVWDIPEIARDITLPHDATGESGQLKWRKYRIP